MATLEHSKSKEMSFAKALARAKTGDIIKVSASPPGIINGERFSHALGVMSLIGGRLYLNDTVVCSNDVKETHGEFYPFYEWILIYRKSGYNGHEFYWMRPTDPNSASKNTLIIPKPGFRLEAETLSLSRLSSGKGLLIVEQAPKKRILLLKKKRIFGKTLQWISPKNVPAEWKGPHATYIETPSSVVVGVNTTLADGTTITRFFRGHGRNRVAVHDHPGSCLSDFWATDVDFYYKDMMYGEKAIISATTGKPVYIGMEGDLYATSEALVRRNGTLVEANGVSINDSFNADWILAHSQGLFFGWAGQIRMLVVKDILQMPR